ncbi:hypothetical protein QAD02_019691 [Eretmocerus hayati]|uniref:Uncharacterized protein n=1 Tax=Eretmocerus hayati TaxID=131215 RepID=A0ACC2PMU6_9HYME|nr:hypothetical protein QAD02_019691 [Eretmocerus hayati]
MSLETRVKNQSVKSRYGVNKMMNIDIIRHRSSYKQLNSSDDKTGKKQMKIFNYFEKIGESSVNEDERSLNHKIVNHSEKYADIEKLVFQLTGATVLLETLKLSDYPVKKGVNLSADSDDKSLYKVVPLKTSIFNMVVHYCPQCNEQFLNDVVSDIDRGRNCCKVCKTLLTLKCLRCDARYTSLGEAKNHLESKCNPIEFYSCSYCTYNCSVKSKIYEHLRKAHVKIYEFSHNSEGTSSFDYGEGVAFVKKLRFSHTAKKIIDVTKTLSQLFCGKVILRKIPYVPRPLQVISNASLNRVHDSTENSHNDEFFFKDPGKKRAIQMSKPFCSKCDRTIENVSRKIRKCPECGTSLFYKCMTCNSKLTHIDSYRRHLQKTCPGTVDRQKVVGFKPKKSCKNINNKENSARKKNVGCKSNVKKAKSAISKTNKSTKNIDKKSTASKKKIEGPPEPKECPRCGTKVVYLQKHLKYCGEAARIPCPFCSYRTHHQRSLKLHLKTHLKFRRFNVQDVSMEVAKRVKKRGALILIKRYCQKCNLEKEIRKKPDMHCKKACLKCNTVMLYRCIKCKMDFDRYSRIAYHVKSHDMTNSGPPVKCQECGLEYLNSEKLKRHQKYCGPNVKTLQCERCPYTTKYPKCLKSHYLTHEKYDEKMLPGNEDPESVSCQNLESPQNVSFTGKAKNFTRKGKTHNLAASMDRFCKKCDVTYPGRLFRYSLTCSRCKGELHRQCGKCKEVFDTYAALAYHLRATCKLADIKPIKYKCGEVEYVDCKKCGKVVKESTIVSHENHCGKEAIYFCTLCSYKSKFESNLRIHLQSHENRKLKDFEKLGEGAPVTRTLDMFQRYCPTCKRSFKNQPFRNDKQCKICNTHLQMECLKCKMRTISYGRIAHHVRYVCGGLWLKCSECDFQCSSKSNLENHFIRKHTIIDPENYKTCPDCGKLFKLLDNLKKHMKICQQVDSYFCNDCPYSTKHKKSIRNHVSRHLLGLEVRHWKIARIESKTSLKEKNRRIESNQKKSLMKGFCEKCKRSRILMLRRSKCRVCKSRLSLLCGKCDLRFPNIGALRLHAKSHLEDIYQCSKCVKGFGRLENLKMHEKMCEKQSPPIELPDDAQIHVDEQSALDVPFMHEDLCEVQLTC